MLVELRLKDLAVAADVHVHLGSGLNALTGSTGAGKSLVVEALRWIAGGDVDRNVMREGATSASAEAVFDLDGRDDVLEQLADLGVETGSDGFLVLRREVRREGRTRAYLNGRASSAALLQSVCERLIEMQSQHEQMRLRRGSEHVHVLDELGVDVDVRRQWRVAHDAWLALLREIAAWESRQRQLRDQRELLEFQRRELKAAALQGDEMDELRARVALLEGGAQLVENAAAVLARLQSDEDGAQRVLAEATHRLRHVPEDLHDLVEARDRIEAAIDLVQDAERTLERFVDAADVDPEALAQDQARLAELQTLTRKYGMTEGELVALRDRLESELGGLSDDGTLPPALARRHDEAIANLVETGSVLDRARRRVARRVERDAPALLEELGMPGATLRFEFVPEEDAESPVRIDGRRVRVFADGPSRVAIVVRTNPGERPGPVETVASGGELSRIGLVLRTLASGRRAAALLVLDEVDAGLGADLGPAMARRLRALAERGQVLVITHLPAVAAAADTQLVAAKSTEDGRTVSRIQTVEGDTRVVELQRMIGARDRRSHELATSLLQGRGIERSGTGSAS